VLINLIRGSGLRGLGGIPPVRDHIYIRPLIRLSKSDILEALEGAGQPFCIDATNADTAFLRNRIRHELIPLLEKAYNPSVGHALNRLSRISRQEERFLETQTLEAFNKVQIKSGAQSVVLDRRAWSGLDPALKPRVLRRAIHQVKEDLNRISHVHMDAMLALCRDKGPQRHLDLPGRIRIYTGHGTITVKKETLDLRTLGRKEKAARRAIQSGHSRTKKPPE